LLDKRYVRPLYIELPTMTVVRKSSWQSYTVRCACRPQKDGFERKTPKDFVSGECYLDRRRRRSLGSERCSLRELRSSPGNYGPPQHYLESIMTLKTTQSVMTRDDLPYKIRHVGPQRAIATEHYFMSANITLS